MPAANLLPCPREEISSTLLNAGAKGTFFFSTSSLHCMLVYSLTGTQTGTIASLPFTTELRNTDQTIFTSMQGVAFTMQPCLRTFSLPMTRVIRLPHTLGTTHI